MRPRLPLLAALGLFVISGCATEPTVSIEVTALVGGEPVECGRTYSGVGTTGTDLLLADLRLYVHDVRLVTDDGRELPVALEQDGTWQVDDIALLDFEDGTSDCTMGTAGTNTRIVGTVAEDAPIVGVRMTLGVPEDRNHQDVSGAPSPLGFQSMYWGWNGGYKFFRLDGRTTGFDSGFFVHLGSTACEGDGRGNITGCAQDNRVEIEVMGFDPAADHLVLDVAELLRESDLDTNEGGPAECMSGFDDPDCRAVFHALGLPFMGDAPSGPQRLLRVAE